MFGTETTAFLESRPNRRSRPASTRSAIAGEPERETRAKRERDGISVDDNTWNDIVAAGAKLKVAKETLDRLATGG